MKTIATANKVHAAPEDARTAARPAEEPWKRTLIFSLAAQLLGIIGFSCVTPFLPFFVAELGVADAGRQAFWSGMALAAGGVTFALFAPFWGALADRYGRKPMVCRAMLGGALALLLISFSRTVPHLLLGRLFQGACSGTLAANIALVASVVPMRRSSFALGMMQAAVFVGNAIGPLVGGAAADAFGYRLSFQLGALLTFLAGGLTFWGTQERFTPPGRNGAGAGIPGFRSLFRLPGFVLGVLVLFSVRFSNSIANPSFPLIMKELVDSPLKLNMITGAIIGTAAIAGAAGAGLLGYAGDRLSKRRVLIGCCLTACATAVGHYFVNSIPLLFILRVLFGFAVAGMLPAANAMIHAVIDARAIGKAYGLATALSMLGAAAGPALGGGLAMSAGLRLPFLVNAVAHLLLVPLLIPGRGARPGRRH